MFIDARQIEPDSQLAADVAVVGGGAAGISIARELAGRGLGVVLLESGGFAYDQETQRLYTGAESGTLLTGESLYLPSSRLRYYGGSTNHWNGWCRPLDPEVFLGRDWIEPHGWPITRKELDPFYERAAALAGITPFDYPEHWLDQPNKRFLFHPRAELETTFFHLSPPTRFGAEYRRELEAARDVRVLTHANVTAVEAAEGGRRIDGLAVACLEGPRFRVVARQVVLAAGGIENARLLLASNDVEEAGLGNRHDLVGRYFMDHPISRAGFLLASSPQRSVTRYTAFVIGRRGHKARGVLRAGWELQQAERIGNSLIVLDPLTPGEEPPLSAAMKEVSVDLTRLEIGDDAVLRRRVEAMGFRVVTEPVPRADSRVTLDAERDALGVPRSRLEWRLGEEDAARLRRVGEVLARELSWRLRGRAHLLLSPGDTWPRTAWSNHHMGTTRMADDPRRGVVDADCRVHGLGNLWVAGSSVFPTAGCSNPTFTILALALRLADRLAEELAA